MPESPFVLVDRSWHLIPNFGRRASRRQLQQLLRALLAVHAPERILILRPMTAAEVRLLQDYRANFDEEVFARIAFTEDRRLGRAGSRR